MGPAPAGLAIPGQAEPVAPAEYGLDDLRVTGILLDLAAQVLHVRVDRPLVALELIPANPVDQLETRVHPARHRGQGDQDSPFGRSQVDLGPADLRRPPRLVDDQRARPEPAHALLGR